MSPRVVAALVALAIAAAFFVGRPFVVESSREAMTFGGGCFVIAAAGFLLAEFTL